MRRPVIEAQSLGLTWWVGCRETGHCAEQAEWMDRYRFHARDLQHVVTGPSIGVSVRFRVLNDGQPLASLTEWRRAFHASPLCSRRHEPVRSRAQFDVVAVLAGAGSPPVARRRATRLGSTRSRHCGATEARTAAPHVGLLYKSKSALAGAHWLPARPQHYGTLQIPLLIHVVRL
jgi:hypothetical protein